MFPPNIVAKLRCVYQLFEQKSPITNKVDRTISRFKRKLLSLEIKYAYWILKRTTAKLRSLENKIIRKSSPVHFVSFLNNQQDYHKGSKVKSTAIREKKLKNLSFKLRLEQFNEGWLENLTQEEIPVEVKNCLSLGKNFNHNPGLKKKPVFELITDIEGILEGSAECIPKTEIDITRGRIANIILNHANRNDKNIDLNDKRAQQMIDETKKFLNQEHLVDKITITESDKGKKTVFMYTEDYNKAMEEMLDDRTRFLHLRKDPTNEIQKNA